MIKTKFEPFPVLNTTRLILRKPETTDDRDQFILRSDPQVNKYLEGFMHASIEETRSFIDTILKSTENGECVFWLIHLKETGQFVGTICLWNISPIDSKAETGFTLHPEFQGKGYMHEALTRIIDFGFKNMKLKAIEAYTHMDNIRSIKLLAKNSFQQDVTHKLKEGSKDVLYKLTSKTYLAG